MHFMLQIALLDRKDLQVLRVAELSVSQVSAVQLLFITLLINTHLQDLLQQLRYLMMQAWLGCRSSADLVPGGGAGL